MKMATSGEELCELCHGLHGSHRRAKHAFDKGFETEYQERKRECERLEGLFRDVAWYNFERLVRKWKAPWRGDLSYLELCGITMETSCRNGRMIEIGRFPPWYIGPSSTAPSLPLEIIESEYKSARKELAAAKENLNAATDWAPGGYKYLMLLRDDRRQRRFSEDVAAAI